MPTLKQIEFRRSETRRLKVDGYTYAQIGERLDITRQCAQNHIKIAKETNSVEKCELCGKAAESHHRHHTNYQSDAFQILCISCHTKIHNPKNMKQKTSKM